MGMLLPRAGAGEERVVVGGLTGGTLKCNLQGGNSLPHRGQGPPTHGCAPPGFIPVLMLSWSRGPHCGTETMLSRELGLIYSKALEGKKKKEIMKGKERNPICNLSSAQDPHPRCCHLPSAFPLPPSPILGHRGTPIPGDGQLPVPTCAHCPALPPRAPQPPAAAPGPGGKQEALPSTLLRK